MSNKYGDIESQNAFENKTKIEEEENDTYIKMNPRMGLIRKVYGILCCQLILTVLMCLPSMYSPFYFAFMMSTPGLAVLICAIVLTIVIAIMLFCCVGFARQVPMNYVLLLIFTICEAYLVSYCCATTSPKIVLMAAILTLAITVSLTIYAMTTKIDFSYMGGMMFVFGFVLLFSGMFMLFTDNPILHVVYASIGVCFYGLYLIYDTQTLLNNKRKYGAKLDVDEYVLGAIQIYMDVVLLFVYVLELFSNLNELF
jgi:hypothetical protein